MICCSTGLLVIHLGSLTDERHGWMWNHYREFLYQLLAGDLPDQVEKQPSKMMAKMGLK